MSNAGNVPQQGNTVDLEAATRHPVHLLLKIARGDAIQGYANLETSLMMVFSLVSGTPMDVAGVIFYKITNTGARTAILDKLMRMKYGDRYSRFWNSFFKELKQIDLDRNSVIHWNTITEINGNTRAVDAFLEPSNFFDRSPGRPRLSINQLTELAAQWDFFSRLAAQFFTLHSYQRSLPEDATWRDIFQRPITYPPQLGHPLYPTPPTPDNPPQASPA